MVRAVVVGGGPNGLAAALTLAQSGAQVTVLEAKSRLGGGTASAELTIPGLIHDVCAGFHPLAVDNDFARSADLAAHGLRWCWPEVQYSHPLGTAGDGASAFRSLAATAQELGVDESRWRHVFGPLVDGFPLSSHDVLQPLVHFPRHPVELAKFGLRAAMPANAVASAFRTARAKALVGGVAAHGFVSFGRPLSASVGTTLAVAAHANGWPVAQGGSGAIHRAMTAALRERGAEILTGVNVTSLQQLPAADIVMLDVAPSAAIAVLGELMPARVRRSLRRYRHGPAVFKVDYAIDGGVPWRHLASRAAGTVHLGGTFAQIRHAENEVLRGRVPAEPFVLVGQQFVADPSRSRGSLNPLYAYAHVPRGYTGDLTQVVTATIERYAPGFRERIVAQVSTSPRQMEYENANYIGGDIIGGATTAHQVAFRPRPALDPYWLGYRNVFLCSSSTPPGAGAHGMCGFNAAQSALRRIGANSADSRQK